MTLHNGKIFAIGDIHGCFAKLSDLINRIPYTVGRDRLVFLGDFINRGPESAQVIEFICELKRKDPSVVALMGNHEYMLMEYYRSGDQLLLPYLREMRVEATLAAYGLQESSHLQSLDFLPGHHLDFLRNLLPYWETDSYIFVHAGLDPGIPLAENDLPTLCESRDSFITDNFDPGKKIIFGHTPFELPLVTPTKIGIDTGAVYGNLLTAVELPGITFIHA